ncbi:MAG: type II secretion system protein N [Humidesulfovibrio sp.]|uniref:type II secretion system protein N n=1 Tax=Humidesulfovibrio sp. TaxID=2910988 RepID=UPI0027F13D7C|nr:type II secretion system protein N [Humidesulfovibrio sp.]MDQ7834361.1 type II secretion system protein N [Humidesulfovibrio sp.]
MQIVWRTLPKLVLPAAIGLGAAYLVTSFVPRPAPNLRPPEELRAQGQAYGEESPVRIILERNVLRLESSLFYPLGQPPAPIVVPEAASAPVPPANASAPTQAAFAQADTSVAPSSLSGSVPPVAGLPAGGGAGAPFISASAPLSGGPSVQGLAVRPESPMPSPAPGRQAEAPEASAAASVPPMGPTAAQGAKATAATAPARPAAKAPVAAPAARPAPRPGLDGFRLVGVIAGGERPLAMLQVDGAAVSLRLGQQVRGWTLVSVEPAQVLLQNGGDQRRLELGAAGAAHRAKAP